ncbi:hypothetical protein Plhal703r1_c20g0090761 [Plasmopara halstedii]
MQSLVSVLNSDTSDADIFTMYKSCCKCWEYSIGAVLLVMTQAASTHIAEMEQCNI